MNHRRALGIGVSAALALVALAASATTIATRESSAAVPIVRPTQVSRPIPADRGGLRFVENAGQMDASVAFAAFGCERTAALTAGGFAFALRDGSRREVVEFAFDGATPVRPRGESPTPAMHHYFLGKDGAAHPKHARTFSRAVYDEPWPGVDVVFDTHPSALEYSLVVKPGADATAARFRVHGAQRVEVTSSGELAVATACGPLVQSRPVAWQEKDGERVPVEVAFDVAPRRDDGTSTYGFTLGAHDPSRQVVIDPTFETVSFETGLQSGDDIVGLAADAAGDVYAAGRSSWSGSVPADKGGFDTTLAGTFDTWVGKFDPSGSLIWATFLGGVDQNGSSYDDFALAIAVDQDGRPIVLGTTWAQDFPVTAPPLDASRPTGAWLARLAADGASIVHSRVLGFSGEVPQLAVGPDGSACVAVRPDYVTPYTATVGPASGTPFATLVRVAESGGVLSVLGLMRSSPDTARSIFGMAADSSGAVHLIGQSGGAGSLPPASRTNAYGGGASDGYVLKLNAAGTALDHALFFGGSSDDGVVGIAIDAQGAAYVSGWTGSATATFPRRPHPTDPSASSSAFLAKVSATGQDIPFVQGTNYSGSWVGIDPLERVWIGGGGGRLARWSADGTEVLELNEYVTGIPALRSASEVWVPGTTIRRVIDRSAAPPSGITALAMNARSVRVFWLPESPDDTSYIVQRWWGSNGYFESTVDAATPFVVETGLLPDTIYHYQVIAVTPAANSVPTSEVQVRTPATIKVRVKRANVGDHSEAHADSVRIKGSIKFQKGASPGGFDPSRDGVRVTIGESFTLTIPLGSSGWTSKGSARTWSGSVGAFGSATLTLDFTKHRLVLTGNGLDVNGAPFGQVEVSLRAGNDAGSAAIRWHTNSRAPSSR